MKVSLWFVPLLMAVAAVLLSWLLSRLDDRIPNTLLNDSKFILAGTASEMRASMLSIAGTILATAGVVFSLLTLPLSTVAAQFGSRLLRVFLRDRTTQIVLGMFVATFCYCLATALSIPNTESQVGTPQITVTFGLLLMLLTFASLILLIQHISIMLQAPNIVAAAGSDLRDVVAMHASDEAGDKQNLIAPDGRGIEVPVEGAAYSLKSSRTGYIQFIDPEIILNLAKERDLVLQMLQKPGEFILSGEVAALVWPAAKVDERLANHLRRGVQVGNQRTPTQDVEYAINQLTEIAVRAMSPAINDPFTAMTCLDYLAEGLVKYASYGEADPNFYDEDGRLRLIYDPAGLDELLNAAFDMLRHASCDNASVLMHMLEAIESIGQGVKSPAVLEDLLRHVRLVQAESLAGALIEADKQLIRARCEMLETKLVL
jgi:uncharacterized membrane protein